MNLYNFACKWDDSRRSTLSKVLSSPPKHSWNSRLIKEWIGAINPFPAGRRRWCMVWDVIGTKPSLNLQLPMITIVAWSVTPKSLTEKPSHKYRLARIVYSLIVDSCYILCYCSISPESSWAFVVAKANIEEKLESVVWDCESINYNRPLSWCVQTWCPRLSTRPLLVTLNTSY
jgi:hypothetical protein